MGWDFGKSVRCLLSTYQEDSRSEKEIKEYIFAKLLKSNFKEIIPTKSCSCDISCCCPYDIVCDLEYGGMCLSCSEDSSQPNYEGVTRFYQLDTPEILYDYILCDQCFRVRKDLEYIHEQSIPSLHGLPDHILYSTNTLTSTMMSKEDFHRLCSENVHLPYSKFDKYYYPKSDRLMIKKYYEVLVPTKYKNDKLINDSDMMLIKKTLQKEIKEKYQTILDKKEVQYRISKFYLLIPTIVLIFIYFYINK